MPRANIDPEQHRAIVRRYGGRCLACGRRRDIQLDHVIPVNSGGTDHPSNLQPLCWRHNKDKGDRTIDYRGWRGAWPLRIYRRFQLWRIPMVSVASFFVRGSLVLGVLLLLVFALPAFAPLQTHVLSMLAALWDMTRLVLLGLGGAMLLAWLAMRIADSGWVYPDEHGQLPVKKSFLKRHPELSIQTTITHQRTRIIRAQHPLAGVTHYSPRIVSSPAAEQLPTLAAPLPNAPPFAQVIQSWRPTMQQMLLGYDASGPVYGDIDDLLSTGIAGRPGTGKTTALRFIMAQAYAAGAQLGIIDPQGSLIDLAPRDMVAIRAEHDHEFDRAAAEITDEYEERRAAYLHGKRDFQPFLILADELPLLADDYPALIRVLSRIVLQARKYRMYALISGQGLAAKYFGNSVVRDGLSTRYIFWTTAAQARMAGIDELPVAKELLAALKLDPMGRAILARSKADPLIVAIPNTTGSDLDAIRRQPALSVALEPPGSDGSTSHDVPETAQNEASGSTSITSDELERVKIITLAQAGLSRNQICKHLFGSPGGRNFARVKQVLDEAGL